MNSVGWRVFSQNDTILLAVRHKLAHPALTPASKVGTRFTYPGGMEGWVDLGALITPRPGIDPKTSWSIVDALTAAPPEGHVNHCVTFAMGNRYSKEPPTGVSLWGIEWSRNRWRHLTLKGQTRDPNTLKAQYLENSWICYLLTIAVTIACCESVRSALPATAWLLVQCMECSAGAHVIMACRSQQRAEEARQDIVNSSPNADVIVMLLDLASLRSIKQFADDFNRSMLLVVSQPRSSSLWPLDLTGIRIRISTNKQSNWVSESYTHERVIQKVTVLHCVSKNAPTLKRYSSKL